MKPIISNYDVISDGESVGVLENGDWLQLVSASGGRHHYRLSSVTCVGFRSRRTDSLLMIAGVLFLIAAAIALLLGNAGLVMSGRSDFLTYVIAVLFFLSLGFVFAWSLSERMRLVMQFGHVSLLIVGTPQKMWPLIDYMKKNYGLD
jgi:hypothetical protein